MYGRNARLSTCLLTASLLLVLGAPAVPADHDGDPFPDSAEALVCGFPDLANTLNGLPPEVGRCVGGTNYVSPLFNPGPTTIDQDADRFPDALEGELCGRPLTRSTINGSTATFGHFCATTTNYSPPTTNASLLLPIAAQPGADADADGFPSTVTFTRLSIVVRPFGAVPVLSVTNAPEEVRTVDPDDADPNVPTPSILTLPTPIPSGTALGSDADGDGFPASVTISQSTVTVDRRTPLNAVTLAPAAPITTGIDPNDADPNTPLVSVFTAPIPVPTGTFSTGPDADRDGFPTTLTVNRANVTFDRRNPANPVTLSAAAPVTQAVDSNDANPDVPATSIVILPVPIATGFTLGADGDADDVPSSATIQRAMVTFDRRGPNFVTLNATAGVTSPIDPNDADANTPAASTFGPVSIPTGGTHSPDADDDYVPHHVTLSFLDVTVDRRTSSPNHVTFGNHTTQTTLDADDTDRGDPIPFDLVDADADLVPDAVEPFICQVQNENTPDDGRCGTPDGSNLNDYTPPVDAPNPWNLV